MMACRGVRGATTVLDNTRDDILAATEELLRRILGANSVTADDIAGIFFTVTDDLDAEYPALAARRMGLTQTAMLCAREIPVQGERAEKCIRVMLFINTDLPPARIRHVYLRGAAVLRPEWAEG